MPRVFIIHGWEGYPEEGWFPWLKQELEKNGFKVHVPPMPNAEQPRINEWIPKLAETVGKADEQCYFVGHSIGCQTIVRYLEKLPENIKVGGAVFVAGFFKRLTNLEEDAESQETYHHWIDTPVDFNKVKLHLNKSVAIFSDNDPYVPLDNQTDFKEKLGSEIIIEKQMGHFSGPSDNILELPITLEAVLKIAKKLED